MIALTRDPSGRRASTIGELSSTRRPTPLTMRSMTRSRCSSSWNVVGDALEHAAALHVHLLVGVDQDVADRRVAQQRLERPEPEDFVEHLAEERLALARLSGVAFFGEQLEEQRADFALRARAIGLRQRLEVQAVEQLLVNVGLQLEVLLRAAPAARSGRGRRRRRSWTGTEGAGNGIHMVYQSEAMRSMPSIPRFGGATGGTSPVGPRMRRVN